MSAGAILRDVKALLSRAHYADTATHSHLTMTAVDQHGQRVRPLSPDAVKWSTAGAIQKVAPARSAHDETVWGDETFEAHEAYLLPTRVARAQGYRNVNQVDAAGWVAVSRMLTRAIQLAPDDESRRVPARGTGNQPRGADCVR